MREFWGIEGLFRKPEIFDPEFVPPEIFHRDAQMRDLAITLRPVLQGAFSGHILCVGPPSTGKTTVVRHVLTKLDEHSVKTAYIKSPVLRTTYNIFAKIYEAVQQKLPPQKGVPLFKLIDEIGEAVKDSVLVVALDDLNFLRVQTLNEVLSVLVKGLPFKCVVIGVATEKNFLARIDPYTGSIFHFHEIAFPLYSSGEIREILRWRVREGFIEGAVSEEAFEKVVELTAKNGDIRYGLWLLREAGIAAEKRGSERVELEDVEAARIGEEVAALVKSVAVLSSDEREALKIIYTMGGKEITTGAVYAVMKCEVGLRHERFYEILDKLERLRFIDLVVGKRGRGWTRYIMRRYDVQAVLRALKLNL